MRNAKTFRHAAAEVLLEHGFGRGLKMRRSAISNAHLLTLLEARMNPPSFAQDIRPLFTDEDG